MIRPVEVDIDAPQAVVHVSFEFARRIIASRRADTKADDAVVLEAVLDEVAIIGGVEAGPQDELLPAAHARGCINPHHAAIAHFLYDNGRIATKTPEGPGRLLVEGDEGKVVRNVPEARAAAVIRDEHLREACVAENLHPGILRAALEPSVLNRQAVAARCRPAHLPGSLH